MKRESKIKVIRNAYHNAREMTRDSYNKKVTTSERNDRSLINGLLPVANELSKRLRDRESLRDDDIKALLDKAKNIYRRTNGNGREL